MVLLTMLRKAAIFSKLKKTLIALSGGVDSATCAVLMKNEGYELLGATMRLHKKESSCLTENDINDAAELCKKLEIPYHVVDFSSDFDKFLMILLRLSNITLQSIEKKANNKLGLTQ